MGRRFFSASLPGAHSAAVVHGRASDGLATWATAHSGDPIDGRIPMHRLSPRPRLSDDGSVTAEYAVATMAAVGFAGLLVVILRSEEVRGILTDLVRHALAFGG
jgi:hypothetical protein